MLERFHFAERLNLTILKPQCIEYIHTHAPAVLTTDQWKLLSTQTPYFVHNLYQDLSTRYVEQSKAIRRLERRQRYHHFYDIFYPALIYLLSLGLLAGVGYTFYLIYMQMHHILPTVITVIVLVLLIALVVERIVRNKPMLRQTLRLTGQRIGLLRAEPIYCTAEYHSSGLPLVV